MQLRLPGGLPDSAGLVRHLTRQAISGELELLLADTRLAPRPWPQFVSQVLGLAFGMAPGQPMGESAAAALCVADRQFLLLDLARSLWGEVFWVASSCVHCRAAFDLQLSRSGLPVRPAGAGFPFVSVTAAGQHLTLRLPTGADQAQLFDAPEDSLLDTLISLCLVGVDGKPAARAVQVDLETLAQIDAAMESVSPEVTQHLLTRCPECGCEQIVAFDPFGFDQLDGGSLFDDIHQLASRYHWSEATIVALPRARRRHYLGLIDAAQGWAR